MTERVKSKTMIVTGASQGIGAGLTRAFIKRGYNVVANSRKISESDFAPTDRLVLVDGSIGEASTAASPMGMISDVDDIVEAIVYLTEARHVTGEVLHVDAGAHNGKW